MIGLLAQPWAKPRKQKQTDRERENMYLERSEGLLRQDTGKPLQEALLNPSHRTPAQRKWNIKSWVRAFVLAVKVHLWPGVKSLVQFWKPTRFECTPHLACNLHMKNTGLGNLAGQMGCYQWAGRETYFCTQTQKTNNKCVRHVFYQSKLTLGLGSNHWSNSKSPHGLNVCIFCYVIYIHKWTWQGKTGSTGQGKWGVTNEQAAERSKYIYICIYICIYT